MSFTDSADFADSAGADRGFKVIGRRPITAPSPDSTPAPSPARDGGDDQGFKVLARRPALASPAAVQALLDHGRRRALEMDADIDYRTGASWDIRAQVQGAANPNEIVKILDKRYGKGNYGQDRNGQWWVNDVVAAPDAETGRKELSGVRIGALPGPTLSALPDKTERRRVAVLPSGFQGGLKNFLSGAVSAPWTTGGALAGGAISTPLGPAGMAGGAAAGAALGAGIDRLQKWLMGTFDQKPAEVVGGVATEAAIAGGAAMLPALVGGAKRGLQRLIQGKVAGTREGYTLFGKEKGSLTEGARMAREMGLGGTPNTPRATPPIGSFAPELTAAKAKTELRDALVGPGGTPAQKRNALYLNARMMRTLQESGYRPQEIQSILKDADSVRSAQLSSRETGRQLTRVATETLGKEQDLAVREREGAKLLLTKEMQAIDQLANAPDSLASNVADAITMARQRFGRTMAEAYGAVDRAFGGHKVVSTIGIQQAAQQLVDILPPSQLPPQIVKWSRGFFTATATDIETRITSEQAHALRTFAREKGEITELAAPGTVGHIWRDMANAADAALKGTEEEIGQLYAGQLQALDTQYREGIRKFHNKSINQLVQQVRSGIVPTPEVIASQIMKTDSVNLATEVLELLPSAARTHVLQADLRNMLIAASRMDKTTGGHILDGEALLKVLHDRGNLLDRTWPKSVVNQLRLHAAQLAAFDGQIDISALRGLPDPRGVVRQLENAAAAAQAADRFATRHPLGALASGDPTKVDAAVRAVMRAGAEETTESVFKALEGHPEAVNALRRFAVTRLFSHAVLEVPGSLQRTVSGSGIDKTLRGLTPHQQELLFPGGLADDLRTLAKEANFLFPKPPTDAGASLAARSIQQNMPFGQGGYALYKYIRARFAGWLYDNPKMLRYLTDELKDNPIRGRAIMRTLVAREAARGFASPPKGQPSPVQPQSLMGLRPGQQNGGPDQGQGAIP